MTVIPRREFLWQALAACAAGALVPAPRRHRPPFNPATSIGR